MIDQFQMIIDGVNVTTALDEKSFPQWVTTAVGKADPFRFKIIRERAESLLGKSLAREMSVLLSRNGSGEILLRGFIDSLGEKNSSLPQITAYPNALLLKDTRPGTEKNLSDPDWESGDSISNDSEIVREFSSDGAEHLRLIVQKMLVSINEQKGTNFTANETTIPDSVSAGQEKFFGNILEAIDQSSWWWILLGPLSALVSWLSEDSFQLRRKNGTYYLVKKDFGVFQKLWIVAGGLLNISPSLYIERGFLLSWSRFDIYVPSSNITLFDWGRWTLPGEDWTLPNIGVQMTIYRLASGGLQQVATESLSIFPMPDANPSSSEMTERYGPVINLNSSANIPHSRIRAFLDEEGYQADRAEILTRFDLDERNTYAIVKAQKKKNDLSGSTLLLSFETTYDDHYEVHFRDEKASEILNSMAAVSNRQWLVDNTDRVHLLEKEHTGSTFTIQPVDLLSITQTEEKATQHVTQIKRYEEDQAGKITSWGIKLRKNEYEAIMNDLEAEQEKSLNRTDVEVIRRTGTGLLNEAQMDGVSYGQVMVRSQHLYNPIDKLKLEVRI